LVIDIVIERPLPGREPLGNGEPLPDDTLSIESLGKSRKEALTKGRSAHQTTNGRLA
jgi:hypothetical protein